MEMRGKGVKKRDGRKRGKEDREGGKGKDGGRGEWMEGEGGRVGRERDCEVEWR